jgi:transposase
MKETNESRGTVQRVKETMGLPPSNNKGGRPKVLTEREQKFLVQTITTGGKSNAVEARKELQEQLGKAVSDETVRRSLKASGMVPFVKPKKPLLTSKHRKERLKWAKEHINWTLDDWKKVVWSDETKVNLFGSDGEVFE